MARKKKQTVKKASATLSATNNAQYKGAVVIDSYQGTQHLKTNKYNNEGRTDLFKGIALALAHNSAADKFLPQYLRTYNIGDVGASIPEKVWNLFITDNQTSLTDTYFNTTPNVTTVTTGNGQNDTTLLDSATVTLKFMLPLIFVNDPESTTGLALLNNNGDVCAYICLTDANNNLVGLVTSGTTSDRNDYNFQIQWKLTIKN